MMAASLLNEQYNQLRQWPKLDDGIILIKWAMQLIKKWQ